MNILDVGCGIDVEEKMLEQAKKKCPGMDIRLMKLQTIFHHMTLNVCMISQMRMLSLSV